MVNDAVCYHVMYLLPVRVPSWKNVYWGVSFACLKIRFSFYYWGVRVFVFSKFKFLIRYTICKYFLPFCGLTFTFWSLKHKSFKFWWSPVYLLFLLLFMQLLSVPKKSLSKPKSWRFIPLVLPRTLYIEVFHYFGLIFIIQYEGGSHFILMYVNFQLFKWYYILFF